MTSANVNIFRVTGPLYGEFTGHQWIPLTKASDAELDVFFDLCLNKQWRRRWFDTQSRSLSRHCNDLYGDVIMSTIASQFTSLAIVSSTVYSDADQRKHQSSASLAFARGLHRGPVNSPHKWPVTRKMLPFDDVIMSMKSDTLSCVRLCLNSSHKSNMGSSNARIRLLIKILSAEYLSGVSRLPYWSINRWLLDPTLPLFR